MNQESYEFEDELNLSDLLNFASEYRKVISITTIFFTVLSITVSLILSNIYSSSAILYPNDEQQNMSSVLSSYSSLANFAGVDLPGEGTSKSEEAIERLKSFDFFKNHFLPYVKLENLMAVKEWSSESNVVTYNKKIFNNKTNQWIRKVKFPKKQKPSSQEAYEEFSKIFSVSADKETNFVKISLEHESPHIAKEWLDIIVKNINESMRDFDIANAENAIDFLYKRSNDTNILEIKEAISHLLESQMQTLMMASINDDFVFKVIDSPAISEEKIKPSRALICILGTLIGLFFGILVAIMMKFQSKK